jgi:hypothetical protein
MASEDVCAFIVNDLANPMDMLTDDTKFRNLIRYLGAALPAAIPLPVRCFKFYILCQPMEGANPQSFMMRSIVRPIASLNELAALACSNGCLGARYVDDRVMAGGELLVFELADANGNPLGAREAQLISGIDEAVDLPSLQRAAAHERRTVLAALATSGGSLASAAAQALEIAPLAIR